MEGVGTGMMGWSGQREEEMRFLTVVNAAAVSEAVQVSVLTLSSESTLKSEQLSHMVAQVVVCRPPLLPC